MQADPTIEMIGESVEGAMDPLGLVPGQSHMEPKGRGQAESEAPMQCGVLMPYSGARGRGP